VARALLPGFIRTACGRADSTKQDHTEDVMAESYGRNDRNPDRRDESNDDSRNLRESEFRSGPERRDRDDDQRWGREDQGWGASRQGGYGREGSESGQYGSRRNQQYAGRPGGFGSNQDSWDTQGYRDQGYGETNRYPDQARHGQSTQSHGSQSYGNQGGYADRRSANQGGYGDRNYGNQGSHGYPGDYGSQGHGYGQGAGGYGNSSQRSGGQQLGGSHDWRGGSGDNDWRRFSGDRSDWSGGTGAHWSPSSERSAGRLYERDSSRGTWTNSDSSRSLFERQGFYGKGPKNYTRSDERIREDVCDRLSDDDEVDASDVTVTVRDGEVTLEGTVNDRRAKHRAEDIADNVRGVKDVHNRLSARKGMLQEIGDRITGKEENAHGHAGSGTKNSGSSASSTMGTSPASSSSNSIRNGT
jgi:osmotically-inducible protein OsmY